MTAFKVWNGTAWDDPKWCTDRGTIVIPPTWESYQPPTTVTTGEYSFDADDGGWSTNTPEAHTWTPGEWRIYGVGDGVYRYLYGPAIGPKDGAPKYKNYHAGMEFYCVTHPGPQFGFRGYFYCAIGLGGVRQVDLVFTAAGQSGWILFPSTNFDRDVNVMSMSFYGATTIAGYDVRLRSAYYRADDGVPITKYTSGVVPKVWDGAQWIPQNRA